MFKQISKFPNKIKLFYKRSMDTKDNSEMSQSLWKENTNHIHKGFNLNKKLVVRIFHV